MHNWDSGPWVFRERTTSFWFTSPNCFCTTLPLMLHKHTRNTDTQHKHTRHTHNTQGALTASILRLQLHCSRKKTHTDRNCVESYHPCLFLIRLCCARTKVTMPFYSATTTRTTHCLLPPRHNKGPWVFPGLLNNLARWGIN